VAVKTDEIDNVMKVRVRDFDGVFSIDTLPEDAQLLVCNADL